MEKQIRFELLDGLRSLSIFWLVGFHALWFLGFFIPGTEFIGILKRGLIPFLTFSGHYGVDIFFVLSGFLITNVLLIGWRKSEYGFLKDFYRRRAFRILPAYIFCAFVYCLFSSFIPFPSNNQNLWQNSLFINNYFPIRDQAFLWSWSLAIEEQFYILFPLVFIFAGGSLKKITKFSLCFLALALVVRGGYILTTGPWTKPPIHPIFDWNNFYLYFDKLYGRTHMRFGAIVLGVLARLFLEGRTIPDFLNRRRKLAEILTVISFLTFGFVVLKPVAIAMLGIHDTGLATFGLIFDRYLLSLAFSYLILYSVGKTKGKKTWWENLLSSPKWRLWADLSYSAFLLNPIVTSVVATVLKNRMQKITAGPLLLYISICYAVTFALSYLVYSLVERPFLRMGRNQKRPRVVSESTPVLSEH